MNAKHNPSILRMIVTAGFVLCTLQARSQEIYEWEAWRTGRNIAGLGLKDSPRGEVSDKVTASMAELFGGCDWGGFRSGSEAQTLWNAGARASGEAHWRDLLLQGDFSFSFESGKNMMGSMFTEPGYYPIDILEFTPGIKTLQRYGAGGGFAWKNNSRFIPGCTLRFEGANYAKRKDIRHTTYRQSIEVVPSLVWEGDGFALGGSAVIRGRSEFIQAEQIGSATAESYYAFLDKGLMYGTYQVWDGNGVHLSEAGVDRLPVRELTFGGALQGSVGNWLYADLEYLYGTGEAGEKGYTWFRFPSSSLKASLSWTLHRSEGVHLLRAEYMWRSQENDETVLDKITEGGVTTPVEYTSNRIFERRNFSAGASYKFYGESGIRLSSSLVLSGEKSRSTLMYPYFDTDRYTRLDFEAEALFPIGAFDLEWGVRAGGLLGKHHSMLESEQTGIGVTSEPYRLENWYESERELLDAPRVGARFGLGWNFAIARNYHFRLSANYSFTHAFGVVLLPGDSRESATLKLSYIF